MTRTSGGNRRKPKAFERPVEIVDLGGRVPPHDLDAEATVLAALLADGRKLDVLLSVGLVGDHFYADANRRIFEAAVELGHEGQPVDLQTVASRLKDRDHLQAVGGIAYIAKLIDHTPAVAHVEAYARVLKDQALKRNVITTCQLAAAEGFGDTGPVAEWVDGVESKLYALATERHTRSSVQAFDSMLAAYKILTEGGAPGVPTGFEDYDDATGGLHDGEFTVIAARPGVGKTSFAMNIATNVAGAPAIVDADGVVLQPRHGVCVFSLEMTHEQLSARIICSDARVDSTQARKRSYTQEDYNRITESAHRLATLPIWFTDTPAIGITELRSKVRREQRQFNRRGPDGRFTQRIGLVIVDYLQLMQGEGDNREQEIAGISRALKAMSNELAVPVVGLSQLNRDVEKRGTKSRRPQLSDLRESGALEQDADAVVFLYRPEMYLEPGSKEATEQKGYAEIILAKQRNGPTKQIPATFHEQWTRFETRSRDAYRPND